ncbi:hypothetical protein ABZ319_12220 [Nocardia sp. NPDC005978]|uniref:hypothetical protein n=1 Tax=Nocardia sp. NPDC005978 TaxID=3156725 RepID=UPI0033B14FDF
MDGNHTTAGEPTDIEAVGAGEFRRRPLADIVATSLLGVVVTVVCVFSALWFIGSYLFGDVSSSAGCGDEPGPCDTAGESSVWLNPVAFSGFWIPLLTLVTIAAVDYVSDALDVRGWPAARRVPLFIWPAVGLLLQVWCLQMTPD